MEEYNMKNSALVVIDLQNDITKNYREIIEKVNAEPTSSKTASSISSRPKTCASRRVWPISTTNARINHFDFKTYGGKNMHQLIGCCGLDCETCDARIATITNDNALREKTATLWTKLNGVTITPEMINCTGCRIEGAKTPFCDKLCPIHNCVREKGLDTCADCSQMENCPTQGSIAANSPFVLENLKQLRKEK